MKTIVVESLSGIKPESQKDIYNALRDCTNKERLAICLYFMSDLPDPELHHDNIEYKLRMIWPPSSTGKLPDDYVDFAAVQRSYFNGEVGRGIHVSERLWENIGKGLWRNTDRGTELAIRALARSGIDVVRRSDTPGPMVDESSISAADSTEQAIPETPWLHPQGRSPLPETGVKLEESGGSEDILETAKPGSLLAYIDQILSCLSEIDADFQLRSYTTTTLVIEGQPSEIQATVRSMMSYASPGEIVLCITLNRNGWHVALDVHHESSHRAVDARHPPSLPPGPRRGPARAAGPPCRAAGSGGGGLSEPDRPVPHW